MKTIAINQFNYKLKVMAIGIMIALWSVAGFVLNSQRAEIALQAGAQANYSLVFFWERMFLVSLIVLLASRLKISRLMFLSTVSLIWILAEYAMWWWRSVVLVQAAGVKQLPEPNMLGLFGATWLEGLFFCLSIGLLIVVLATVSLRHLKSLNSRN